MIARIDLRSDTVTKPTAAMREAMARAEVGDDVFGEDPSVRALEEAVAELAGFEAALFVSTGTMGNQLAIACQTRPGDEVIVGEGAHPVWYESGAGAVLSGVQFATAGSGVFFDADAMDEAIKPVAFYAPRTSMVSVENTHNRGGGRIFPQATITKLGERARERGFAFHLDGARLWNASAVTGLTVAELARPFDTVSLCFSKGLGAPVGSALVGTKDLVERAKRFRKMWGGATRQAGVLAAAALYAVKNHRERLKDDHANARAFAEAMVHVQGVRLNASTVETNIVNVDLENGMPAAAVTALCKTKGLDINPSGPSRIRAVTHMDVSRADVESAARILASAVDAVANEGSPMKGAAR